MPGNFVEPYIGHPQTRSWTHSISFPEEKLEHVLSLASFNPNIVRPSLWMSANDKAKKSPSWMLSVLAGLEFGFTNFQMISQMHVFFLLPDGYLRGKHVLYREPAWTYNGEPQNTSTFHFVRPNSIHRTERRFWPEVTMSFQSCMPSCPGEHGQVLGARWVHAMLGTHALELNVKYAWVVGCLFLTTWWAQTQE